VTAKTTYTLLIYRTAQEELTAEADRAALVGHRALQSLTSQLGELHAVARLDDAPRAKVVTLQSGAHAVTDGPYVEAKEWLVGFYLVDCQDEQEAIERAKMLCPVEGHAIEVRPVTWRWRE
jgi:hypothetical protein